MQKDEKLLELLRPVQDPELFISIVELGLVYGIEQKGEDVNVDLTFTSPACPLGPQLMAMVEQVLREQVSGVKNVHVNVTFDPPWNPKEHCSEDAKMQLGIF